jgi:ATP-dependent Lon protease
VIVPDRNEADVEEIPEDEREQLEFKFAAEIGDALDIALKE